MDLIKYIPLLHKLSNKFPKEYREDLLQEGFIALDSCVNKFDSNVGEPFETFSYKRVYYSMIDFMKELPQHLSLDNEIKDEDGNIISFAELLKSDGDLEQDIINRDYYNHNLKHSSTRDRFIKQRYFEEGMSPRDIIKLYSEYHHITDVRTIKKIIIR